MKKLKIYKLLLLSSFGSLLMSCSNSYAPATSPLSYAPEERASSSKRGFAKQAILQKSADMELEVEHVRQSGRQLEKITAQHHGYVTSYNERDDESAYATYSLRIPYAELEASMQQVSELGEVTHRHLSIDDVTAKRIEYEAHLKALHQRRARYLALLKKASSVEEKIEVEKQLAELENEIFKLELAAKESAKHAKYSKLEVRLARATIDGPVGAAWKGFKWGVGKLFVIRD